MSGLVLKLAAGERVLVNGALIENGDKPSSLRIADGDARVLRCRDALKPEDVNTPVKQVYYAIQLLITGDLKDKEVIPAILKECDQLKPIFERINSEMIPTLCSMVERGNYYSALCHLRNILVIEAELFRHAHDPAEDQAKVA